MTTKKLEDFLVAGAGGVLAGRALQAGDSEVPVVDELRGQAVLLYFWHHGEEGAEFLLAAVAQAGLLGGERVVVVAGVAAELVGVAAVVLGQVSAEHGAQGEQVEGAGGGDAERSGGDEAVLPGGVGELVEGGFETAQDLELGAAEERRLGECGGPLRLKWFAHGGDAAASGDVGYGAGDGREQVCVFVAVDVGDVEAGALQLLDLRLGFAREVLGADGVAQGGLGEIDYGRPEGFAVRAEQRRDVERVRDGDAVDED